MEVGERSCPRCGDPQGGCMTPEWALDGGGIHPSFPESTKSEEW